MKIFGRCSMVEGKKYNDSDKFRGARPRVYGTNPDDPDEGRVFVWTMQGWFERIEGNSGNVAFTPIADSETNLREMMARDSPSADLVELGGEYRKMISEEF